MRVSSVLRAMVAASLVAGLAVVGVAPAGAWDQRGRFPVAHGVHENGGGHRPTTCSGTPQAPGLLAGTYHSTVVVTGVCFVNGGPTTVFGDLVIAPGAGVNASFALNDQPGGHGTTSLTVKGNVVVQKGGLLVMGCEPEFSPCSDDPAQANGGTLTGQNHVSGSLLVWQALGAIVHASTISRDVTQLGGGGGVSCAPPFPGLFGAFQSPPFTDYEDNSVAGNVTVAGLQTCWLGMLRNDVRGSLVAFKNTMADPDAGEIVQNTVRRDIVCVADSPAVQFGDSGASPNVVSGHAIGQCGFDVYQPDPNYPNGDGTGGPQPVSIRAPHGGW